MNREELGTLNDSLIYENTTGDIDELALNTMFTAMADNLSPKAQPFNYFPFLIRASQLDGNNKITVPHLLDASILRTVVYVDGTFYGNRLIGKKRVDSNNLQITFYSGLPNRKTAVGYIYKLA